MHRLTEDHLEEILSGAGLAGDHPAILHLNTCRECRYVVGLMRDQSARSEDLAPQVELTGFTAYNRLCQACAVNVEP